MKANLFNEPALNASVILRGHQIFKELLAIKLQEWSAEADLQMEPKLKIVLARFLEQSNIIASEGKPEKMVELVEQLRSYKPHLKFEDYAQFEVKWTGFHTRLKMLTYGRVGARINEKEEKIGVPYRNEATKFRLRLANIILFLDENKVDALIAEWNEVAAKWRAELEAAGE